MRLFGIALFTAWVLAWWSSPHGEPARPTSIVGGVAMAGGDRAAFAWLELTHGMGERGGRLHVGYVDENNHVRTLFSEDARPETSSFRLADAGDGRFVLAREFRVDSRPLVHLDESPPAVRRLVFEAFDEAGNRSPNIVLATDAVAGDWQFAAAGNQLAVSEDVGDHYEVHLLGDDGEWLPPTVAKRAIVAAAGGRLIRYEVGAHGDHIVVNPAREGAWAMDLHAPDCREAPTGPAQRDAAMPLSSAGALGEPSQVLPRPRITSALPLRGGYARLARIGNIGCVDGMRDGQPFIYRNLDLRLFAAARLSDEGGGRFGVYDVREGQVATRRLLLPERPGGEVIVESLARSSQPGSGASAFRYRLFGRGGKSGIPSLGTRIVPGETEVVFERYGGWRVVEAGAATVPGGSFGGNASYAQVLAPVRAFQPDHRPFLRRLALIPLFAFALAALGSLRLLRRLRRLVPTATDKPLPNGPATVEATLAADAEAPEGGLLLRRGQAPLRLFIEGAEVLRASEVRPRDQPRGDAVDVASGAPVVATGTGEPGSAFRMEDTLRARRGDLVIVGCTLAEARQRVTTRLFATLALLATTGAAIGFLSFR